MIRRKFMFTFFAFFPFTWFAKTSSGIKSSFGNGFIVKSGETRFGDHYKMKGITLNTID